MKVYIDDFPPTNLSYKLNILEQYLIKSMNYIEILSDNGIFNINESGIIYKINVIKDESIKVTNVWHNLKFIIDYTKCSYENVTTIPLNHINNKIYRYEYKIDIKSNLKFIIEFIDKKLENLKNESKELSNSYKTELIPINFYFEFSNIIDYGEIFNNNDFNVFLSLLK